jgi:hypothetical protein
VISQHSIFTSDHLYVIYVVFALILLRVFIKCSPLLSALSDTRLDDKNKSRSSRYVTHVACAVNMVERGYHWNYSISKLKDIRNMEIRSMLWRRKGTGAAFAFRPKTKIYTTTATTIGNQTTITTGPNPYA